MKCQRLVFSEKKKKKKKTFFECCLLQILLGTLRVKRTVIFCCMFFTLASVPLFTYWASGRWSQQSLVNWSKACDAVFTPPPLIVYCICQQIDYSKMHTQMSCSFIPWGWQFVCVCFVVVYWSFYLFQNLWVLKYSSPIEVHAYLFLFRETSGHKQIRPLSFWQISVLRIKTNIPVNH